MKKIVFRADAKPAIGTGDLVSLINLAKYFQQAEWQVHFIVKDNPAALKLLKKHKATNSLMLESRIGIDSEIEKMNNYIEKNGIHVIMLEITERKLTEYAALSEKAIKACINFDGIIPEDIKLVVDWDVDANAIFDTSRYPATKFLLGPQYVILPIEFDFNRINKRTYNTTPKTLLVAMGGADELNFTQRVIDACIAKKLNLNLRIVVGSGYQYLENLEISLKSSGITYTIRYNISDIFDEFMGCDVAIASGGLTSFELIATRTPSYLIATYGHQVARCVYFDKMGWATYLGFRKLNIKAFFSNLHKTGKIPPPNIFKTEEIRKSVDELLTRH